MGTIRHYTISDIKAANDRAEHHFFSRKTMRFFGNTMRDFRVRHVKFDGKITNIYVINTVGGSVWEFDPATGHLNLTKMDAYHFGIDTRPYPKGRWGF